MNDDAVFYGGSSWFAAGDPDLGEVPSTESAHWNPLALQGIQGVQGEPGQRGEKGEKGDWGVTLLVDSRYQEGTTGNHVYESQDVHAGVQSRRGPVGGAGA
ncbi:hypothetical protein ACP6NG_18000, partial [Brevibacterium casei]|uniref:hypothetical protein n=1 Tax=Brevibacterium casei TaxID=33889 RepID=UPI003F7ED178